MNETLESILQFSKDTFPKTTLGTQKQRVSMEVKEFYDALQKDDNKSINEEMSDCLITIIGIARFDFVEFSEYMKMFYRTLDNKDLGLNYPAIDKKMAINRQRAKDNYWVYDEQTKQYVAKHKLDNKE